ncbi:MAG: 50S ribosomal protein L6 [Candidatus Niyogibacteria bacterium]|nr:50S ribosomal protein L6 [Candidatus Niyogibacteria bacterium]
MSRLAKKPVIIPQGVSVEFKDGILRVRGPKGELSRNVSAGIIFEISSGEVFVRPARDEKGISAFLGTYARHLKNMVLGVSQGFEKKLEIEGIGYRAEVKGKDLALNLGFSHQIVVPAEEGITFSVEKNVIKISGIDKEAVGNVAAKIRDKKKPEPYKGKGIRYAGEVVRRKAGKKVATGA